MEPFDPMIFDDLQESVNLFSSDDIFNEIHSATNLVNPTDNTSHRPELFRSASYYDFSSLPQTPPHPAPPTRPPPFPAHPESCPPRLLPSSFNSAPHFQLPKSRLETHPTPTPTPTPMHTPSRPFLIDDHRILPDPISSFPSFGGTPVTPVSQSSPMPSTSSIRPRPIAPRISTPFLPSIAPITPLSHLITPSAPIRPAFSSLVSPSMQTQSNNGVHPPQPSTTTTKTSHRQPFHHLPDLPPISSIIASGPRRDGLQSTPELRPLLKDLITNRLVTFSPSTQQVLDFCHHIDHRVSDRALSIKVVLRNHLKKDPDISSSRREAKVSRLFNSETLIGYQDSIFELVQILLTHSCCPNSQK